MLKLPRNTPDSLRLPLEQIARQDSPDRLLEAMSLWCLKAFHASEIVSYFASPCTPDIEDTGNFYVSSIRSSASPQFAEVFLSRWKASDIHLYIGRDVREHLAPISYSSFSWPYPRFESDDDSSEKELFRLPRGYTMVLPICSELMVTKDNDPTFFGYIALLYDDFPEQIDEIVQLIITLPELLSGISFARLRTE